MIPGAIFSTLTQISRCLLVACRVSTLALVLLNRYIEIRDADTTPLNPNFTTPAETLTSQRTQSQNTSVVTRYTIERRPGLRDA